MEDCGGCALRMRLSVSGNRCAFKRAASIFCVHSAGQSQFEWNKTGFVKSLKWAKEKPGVYQGRQRRLTRTKWSALCREHEDVPDRAQGRSEEEEGTQGRSLSRSSSCFGACRPVRAICLIISCQILHVALFSSVRAVPVRWQHSSFCVDGAMVSHCPNASITNYEMTCMGLG